MAALGSLGATGGMGKPRGAKGVLISVGRRSAGRLSNGRVVFMSVKEPRPVGAGSLNGSVFLKSSKLTRRSSMSSDPPLCGAKWFTCADVVVQVVAPGVSAGMLWLVPGIEEPVFGATGSTLPALQSGRVGST